MAVWEILTTVGYGDDDRAPQTGYGRIYAMLIMMTMGGWAG